MSSSNVDSLPSSDGEYSLVDPAQASSRLGRSSSKKQPSRPKTSYQLAHPAAHARHKRFNLRPKLLLQLQQASHAPRPMPILDVLPSTVYLPKLARKFPTMFRGRKGLGPNDLILVTSELYERTMDAKNKNRASDDNEEHQEIVATVCQLLTEDALAKGKAEICFNDGPTWEATPLPNGSYEFAANTEHGRQTVRWVSRGNRSRRASTTPGAAPQEDTKRFTFSMINPNTRRHPVVASMTRNHLEVFDEYSIPSSVSKPPTAAMSVISDGSTDAPLEGNAIITDDRLRTLIVVTSIWVAFREKWSHNFSYDDSASTFPIPSKPNSPAVANAETDHAPEPKDDHNGTASNGPHVAFRNIRHSNTSPDGDRVRSPSCGKLNKRSNSTSAAFLKRSNRNGASGEGRLNRHSMMSKPGDKDGVPTDQGGLNTQPRTDEAAKGLADDPHPQARTARAAKSRESMASAAGPDNGKTKRRHRISNMFDFLKKR